MWYVNADGKEGWLPSNILRSMIGDDLVLTSGESTPVDIKFSSTGASADASDMSDSDGEFPDLYKEAIIGLSSMTGVIFTLRAWARGKAISFVCRLSVVRTKWSAYVVYVFSSRRELHTKQKKKKKKKSTSKQIICLTKKCNLLYYSTCACFVR